MTVNNLTGKTAVIMGGTSSERDISLMSGANILAALRKCGVDAYAFDPHLDSVEQFMNAGYKRAFIALHGGQGENGTIQGFLEFLKIPYTGPSIATTAITINKQLTKSIWRSAGLPVAIDQYVIKSEFSETTFKLKIDLPIIVKPNNEGSTIGITKVYEYKELISAIHYAFQYCDVVMLEKLIIGTEISTPVFNGKVYPTIRIDPPNANYDYHNKYFTDQVKYLCPYKLNNHDTFEQIIKLAYDVVLASGMTRIDAMLDQDQQVYLLEINTVPGYTDHSLVPQSCNACGMSFENMCLAILSDAKLHC